MIAGAISFALLSAPAKAHGSDKDMCNYNIDTHFSIQDSVMEFEQNSGPTIKIDEYNNLFVDGNPEV